MTDQRKAEWVEWIGYNLSLGVSVGKIIHELEDNGFSSGESQGLIAEIKSHPVYKAAEKLGHEIRKWEVLSEALLELESQALSLTSIPRVRGLSSREFHQEFYTRNRPVIIEDATQNWLAFEKWTNSYLSDNFGRHKVRYQDRSSSKDHRNAFIDNGKECRFDEYIKMIESGQYGPDLYLIAHDRLLDRDEFSKLIDDIVFDERYLDRRAVFGKVFFWLGPKGARTPLHRDLGNVYLVQVRGRKRIKFIPALEIHKVYNSFGYHSDVDLDEYDSLKFPRIADARMSEVIVSPGDMIFIPVGWWHHVVALDECITITGNNFKFINSFTKIF